mmetsp:Transcript_6737/g.20398  ORF Transcript_6737/g.20398 Transcript_6737/m.20398 type:complete len:227 (-) Transcript_6737:183-863(-)
MSKCTALRAGGERTYRERICASKDRSDATCSSAAALPIPIGVAARQPRRAHISSTNTKRSCAKRNLRASLRAKLTAAAAPSSPKSSTCAPPPTSSMMSHVGLSVRCSFASPSEPLSSASDVSTRQGCDGRRLLASFVNPVSCTPGCNLIVMPRHLPSSRSRIFDATASKALEATKAVLESTSVTITASQPKIDRTLSAIRTASRATSLGLLSPRSSVSSRTVLDDL